MKRYLCILAALAFVALSSPAFAVNCFWVGGTGTWDGTNTGGGGSGGIKWASATGGSSACSATSGPAAGVPGASDSAIFDANSGGGTVTASPTGTGLSLINLTAGAFTGTLDFSGSNPSMTISGSLSVSGTGTRNINLGSGTFTLSGTSGTILDVTTTTGLTPTFQNAGITLSGNSVIRSLVLGGQTFGALTINSNSTKGMVSTTAGTFASASVWSGNTIVVSQTTTLTITGALTMTGTASAPVGIMSSNPSGNVSTISVGSASTIDYGAILRMTKSGAGSITANNSFDLGGNTSITINPPTAGGGGRIIGG